MQYLLQIGWIIENIKSFSTALQIEALHEHSYS